MTQFQGAPWVLAIIAFAVVALGVVALVLVYEAVREWRRRRAVAGELRRISEEGSSRALESSLLREEGESHLPPWLDQVLIRLPQLRDLQHFLEQAESSMSPFTFVVLTLGLGAAGGISLLVVTGNPLLPLVGAVTGALLPYIVLARKRHKRIAAFEEGFPEAIDLLGRAIRAGHAFSTGLKVVGDEADEPVAGEFRQVFEEQKFGLPLRDSLMALADRLDSIDVRIFVTAVMIQRESGGNLAEILDNLSYIIRERFKFRRQLRAQTAQGRLTGNVLMVMPIIAGIAMGIVIPDYMEVMFEDPRGRLFLMTAIVLQIMGYFAIRRIVDIDF